jgi:hypothetical protein
LLYEKKKKVNRVSLYIEGKEKSIGIGTVARGLGLLWASTTETNHCSDNISITIMQRNLSN